MPASPSLAGVIHQPFAEQIEFFRRKLNLPTEHWEDIKKAAHDRAYVVAGATKADLLADLKAATEKAISGQTLETFRRDFREAAAKHGWTGWTGEGTPGGEAWRTRVIYETNLRTSYAAGRWQQLNDPALLAERPYWRYVHSDLVARPRLLHAHWGDMGLTLPHDHPFWQTHYPPNGWGCRCYVEAVREPAEGDATEPPEGWDTEGEATGAPPGIDKGWDYAPGANATTPLLDLVGRKLIDLDAPIGARMWEVLAPAIEMEQSIALKEMVDRVAGTKMATGQAVLVGGVLPEVVWDFADKAGKELRSADIWLRDAELAHALRETKVDRGAALPLQTWRDLTLLLKTATPYYDKTDGAIVYVFTSGTEKVAIRVNYASKISGAGGRRREVANFIRTGGIISGTSMGAQYVRLAEGE